MANDPNVQPDNTEWVVVKHTRFPFVQDVVIGHYPDANSAMQALNAVMAHPEFFTTYSVEHREKS